ncbi:MAG TPA: hypothetical protein VGD56_21840 [Gemmatirosa sp.]
MGSSVNFLAAASACLAVSARAAAQDAPTAVERHAGQCRVPGLASLPRDTAAVRCAEWFVARNGYTDAPPADTTELAGELFDSYRSGGWARTLAGRRGTMAPRAVVLCRDAPAKPVAYDVVFTYPGAPDTAKYGRGIAMDANFGQMRVRHVPFLLRKARTRPGFPWCTVLRAAGRPG